MIQRCRTLIPVLALIIIGVLIESAECPRFDLQSGHMKCFAEEIKSNSITAGNYRVVNPNDGAALPDYHKITVRVTSAKGKSFHHYAERVEAGQFGFTACVWLEDPKSPEVMVTVEFECKTGVAAKDWGALAKKGSVDGMEMELKKLMDTVSSIHEEMLYLRFREIEMQGFNRSTNSNMFWLSFTSFFVCFSVASLQFWPSRPFLLGRRCYIPNISLPFTFSQGINHD